MKFFLKTCSFFQISLKFLQAVVTYFQNISHPDYKVSSNTELKMMVAKEKTTEPLSLRVSRFRGQFFRGYSSCH